MLKLTFLGTNGWFDSSTGTTVCALLAQDDQLQLADDRHIRGLRVDTAEEAAKGEQGQGSQREIVS